MKERRKHSTLSLSFVFSSSFPLPSQSAGGSKERIIEKESDAFSRRAWRIPNSDWQLINTASRHSRGQLARPRYRNAIFIAGARARAPIHPHAHTQYTRLRPPHRNCQLYRGNRSPQSPAISPAATSLLMLPPSSSYILDHRHLHRVSSTNSTTVHDRYRYLPRFSICRRVFSHGRNAGLVTYSPRA